MASATPGKARQSQLIAAARQVLEVYDAHVSAEYDLQMALKAYCNEFTGTAVARALGYRPHYIYDVAAGRRGASLELAERLLMLCSDEAFLEEWRDGRNNTSSTRI
jgi:hypothetical protein